MKHSYVQHGRLKLKSSQAHTSTGVNEWIMTPSQSTPAFGSYFTIDFRTKNVIIEDAKLEFNCTAVSGLSGSATYARLSPFVFAIDHIDVCVGNEIVHTEYADDIFVKYQLFSQHDDELSAINSAMGNYSSTSQRSTLAAASSSYYIPLWTVLTECSYPILHSPDIQLRIFLNPLSKIIETDSSSYSCSINYCNLWTKVERNHHELAPIRSFMTKTPLNYRFWDLKLQKFTQQSGVSSCQLILSSIVGNVSWLFFVVRPTSPTGTQQYSNFTSISKFEILDSSSTNMIGGQSITDFFARYVAPQNWGIVTTFLQSNNVYFYSFAKSPKWDSISGQRSGGRSFMGSESLKITFPSTLSSTVEISVYAHTLGVLNVNVAGASKSHE